MYLRLWCNVILICAISTANSQSQMDDNSARFKVIYEWNYINFTWPSEDDLQTAIDAGQYLRENVHISGVKYFENFLYLTLPRMKDGVPATFTRIPYNAKDANTAPLLEPYPSWNMNREGDCYALQNVQNVEIDTNGLLYILDGGRTGTLTKVPKNLCPPRLIIYDTRNNQTVKTHTFPESITNNGSFLYDLVVDDADGGYLYITDNSGVDPGIIVYSIKQDKSWIIRDDTMKARPEAINFLVNGTAVSATINIAGIALGPRQSVVHDDHEIVSQDRIVYYCPLSSYRLYSVNSAYLRDEKSAQTGIANYVQDLGRKASQSDGIVMDEHGILYYGLLADSSVARWDSKTPFTSGQKVIARDRIFIQWPDSLSFDMSGNLLVVTNKLQKFIYGQMDLKESNYRILEGHVGARSYLYSSQDENDGSYSSSSTSETSRKIPEETPSSMENTSKKPGNLYYDTQTTQNAETFKQAEIAEVEVNSANSLHMKIIYIFTTLLLLIYV